MREVTLDAAGKPTARKDGYDEIRRTFDGQNHETRIEYLANGAPALTVSGGLAAIERTYGRDGFIAAEARDSISKEALDFGINMF